MRRVAGGLDLFIVSSVTRDSSDGAHIDRDETAARITHEVVYQPLLADDVYGCLKVVLEELAGGVS